MKIVISEYTKRIKKDTVLDGVTLELESRNVYGLRGENGSGKTMLLRAICGLIRPTSGEIRVDGQRLGKNSLFPGSVGVLIENPAFVSKYSGLKNLKLLADIRGVAEEDDIIHAMLSVGLDSADNRPYRKYSLGMKQKLGIACAVMEHPDLILLDEPYNALDPESRDMVTTLILSERERGGLILIACHNLEEIEKISDKVFCIDKGKVGLI